MPLTNDEDLALAARRGNRAAFATLVRRHHSPLLGYLYRMTGGDRALGEDLVQETFLRILQNLDQYQHPRRFKPWLYAIATNLARDHYKRADTRRVEPMPHQNLNASGEDQPETRLLASDDGRHVAAALAALPAPQREVIVLRFYQELSLAEIAEALAIPLGTVKSRLSIGLQRLKVQFALLDDPIGKSG